MFEFCLLLVIILLVLGLWKLMKLTNKWVQSTFEEEQQMEFLRVTHRSMKALEESKKKYLEEKEQRSKEKQIDIDLDF